MFPINIINFTIILTYLEGVKVYKKPISFIYIFLGINQKLGFNILCYSENIKKEPIFDPRL